MRIRRFVLFALLAPPVAATTYHVRQAPTGNDGNPGTSGSSWATLQHAVDSVAPGDVILVHAGTYVGARIEASGTLALPITLAAAPGESVTIQGASGDAAHNSAIEVESFSGTIGWWVIEGFTIDAAGRRYGIDLRDIDGVVVRGNTVSGAGCTGIFDGFADNVVIEDNETFGNCEHGIYHSNSGDNPIIRRNHSHGNAAAGIHMNGDLSQGGDGTISGALVDGNLIVGNGAGMSGCSPCTGNGGGAGINMDGVTSSLIRNNVILDEHATGISVFRIDGAVCSQNNRFVHNTVIPSAAGRWAILINDIDQTPPAGCPNNTLRNNILWSEHGFRGAISIDSLSLPTLSSDGNLVEGVFTTDDGDTTLTFAQWQALGKDTQSQQIANTTALDALFVDRAGDDVHLAVGSDAIDAGLVVPDAPLDFDGVPRPLGAGYDAGAFEAGELIFADGFESGSTGAWSATVP